MTHQITWRDILDPYDKEVWHGHIDKFVVVVIATGYRYFNWNGNIFKITDASKRTYFNTGLLVEDIK